MKYFMEKAMSETLSKELENALKYNNVEIPAHIEENLSKELREYQIKALKHYLLQRQKPSTNHLMFNMATGSGKTLIMAALMLDCYKRGYRNFVFFVNSLNIIEKTKANFCDIKSGKYLFSPHIKIDNKNVSINAVCSFNESREDCINIIFSSVQSLYSLFTNERENSLNFADLENQKIVYIADEAHHLNSETKKPNITQAREKESWESVIQKAFLANKHNIMLEFTATIPHNALVREKYNDKIIYEYNLKQFSADKYSKRIYLLQYNGIEKEERFLGSLILNIYRMLLAKEHSIFLKPVVLYKSRTIKESQENERLFKDFIHHLNATKIEQFLQSYAMLSKGASVKGNEEQSLFFEANAFFMYHHISATHICETIKNLFHHRAILNVNDDSNLRDKQLLLNSLESKNNEILAIFAVDKLNEGWDVLNLFDIVRLNVGAINDTTKEAQLIGRGARYYPFSFEGNDEVYKRKFDEFSSPLRSLEILSYHAASENEFITRLNQDLISMGLKEDTKHKITLKIKKEIQENEFFNQAYFATNSVFKLSSTKSLFSKQSVQRILERTNDIKIPLIEVKGVIEDEILQSEFISKESYHRDRKLRDIILPNILLKAMNRLSRYYRFDRLNMRFDVRGKEEFITEYINHIHIKLHSRQSEQSLKEPSVCLKIATFVLEHLAQHINDELDSYQVGKWKAKPLNAMGDREMYREKQESVEQMRDYDWFIFDTFVGNQLEKDFLYFIKEQKEKIDEHFSAWFVVRNERMSEFAVYDDREILAGGEVNETYAARFEPDFYFLGKRKGEDSIIVQCLIEAKGEHLIPKGKWKEEFLKSLLSQTPKERCADIKGYRIKVSGMPFYRDRDNGIFKEKFEAFIAKTLKL